MSEIEWERLLLAPVEPSDDSDHIDVAAERAASEAYAAEYGYDVDPITGRYLPPDGEA